jgi:hypothetical protein
MRRALASLALSVVGCGTGNMVQPPPPDGGMALTLGQLDGTGAFVALADGTDVTLVEGAQGGFHVWMDFQAPEAPPADAVMLRTAHRLSDGALILRTSGLVMPPNAPGGAGTFELPSMVPMFMCPSPVGISVIDTPVSFEIEIQDGAGASLGAGSVHLVAHCPGDAAAQAFCQRICTG